MCSIDIFKTCARIDKLNNQNNFKLFMDNLKSQVLIGSLYDVDDEEEEEIIDSPETNFIKDIIDNIINNVIHKVSIYRCCICMEKKEFLKHGYNGCKTTANSFLCQTCNEGKVCGSCMAEIDPRGIIWLNNKKKVNKIITCPCCKSKNWNYYYEYFIEAGLNYDMNDDLYNEPPAIVLYQRNMDL